MREIWGPAWFAAALSLIMLTAWVFGRWEAAAPAFFSFLPVVFFQMARTIARLSARIHDLEQSPGLSHGGQSSQAPRSVPEG